MSNKTFKEEVIEKFNDQATTCGHCHPRGLRKMKEGTNEYQSELDEHKVRGFIKETLNLYKQKILEALPKDDQEWVTDRKGDQEADEIWLRPSEVKQIIENI